MKLFINSEDWEDSFLEHGIDEDIDEARVVEFALDMIFQARRDVALNRAKESLIEAKKPIPLNK